MSARHELGRIIWETSHHDEQTISATGANIVADAVLAAGYSKPRTITTEAELDALPVGSVIRTSGVEDECDPRVAVKAAFWHNESEWFTADDSEWCLSSDELDDLPATVLYTPKES
ncbi:hypothetical protein ACFRJ8_14940 [Arthrobacter sp. NPDC056886]|uniref:hypothetical protein n=1 Tax=Arthrobacter sp. NPDC056886 TaxID=3345960 RepID=UPI0036734385